MCTPPPLAVQPPLACSALARALPCSSLTHFPDFFVSCYSTEVCLAFVQFPLPLGVFQRDTKKEVQTACNIRWSAATLRCRATATKRCQHAVRYQTRCTPGMRVPSGINLKCTWCESGVQFDRWCGAVCTGTFPCSAACGFLQCGNIGVVCMSLAHHAIYSMLLWSAQPICLQFRWPRVQSATRPAHACRTFFMKKLGDVVHSIHVLHFWISFFEKCTQFV